MNLDEFRQQLKSIEQTKVSSLIMSRNRSSYKYLAVDKSLEEFYMDQLNRLRRATYSAKDERMERNLHVIEQHIANLTTLFEASPHLKSIFLSAYHGFGNEKDRVKKEMLRLQTTSRQNQHIYQESINSNRCLNPKNQLNKQADRYSIHSDIHPKSRPNSQKSRVSYFQNKISATQSQLKLQQISREFSQRQSSKNNQNTYLRMHRLMTDSRVCSNNIQKLENSFHKYDVGHDFVQRKTKYQVFLSSTKQKIKPEQYKEFRKHTKHDFFYKDVLIEQIVSNKQSNTILQIKHNLREKYKKKSQFIKQLDLKLKKVFDQYLDKIGDDNKNESIIKKCDTIIQILQKRVVEIAKQFSELI